MREIDRLPDGLPFERMTGSEMKRLAGKVKGFEIGSHLGDKNLGDPYFDPVFKTASDLGQPLFVHPWDMPSLDGRMDQHWLKWLVGMPAETATAVASCLMGGVLERFPALQLVFAHGGGAYPYIAGRVDKGHACRPDLCATMCSAKPSSFRGRFYVDSLVHSEESLKLLLSVAGEDRVMLGTDYPFPLGDLSPHQTFQRYQGIDDSVKTKVIRSTAAELFGLQD